MLDKFQNDTHGINIGNRTTGHLVTHCVLGFLNNDCVVMDFCMIRNQSENDKFIHSNKDCMQLSIAIINMLEYLTNFSLCLVDMFLNGESAYTVNFAS